MNYHSAKSLTQDILEQQINSTVGKPCIICNRLATIAGCFEPKDSQEYGAPKGNKRFIFYPICKACVSDPINTERVEAIIQQELSVVTIQ